MTGLTRGAGVPVALAALVLAAGCSLPGVGGGSAPSSAPASSEPPAVPNTSERNRTINRRVVILYNRR